MNEIGLLIGVFLIVLMPAIAYAAMRAYMTKRNTFFLLLSVAFILSTVNGVVARILLRYSDNAEYVRFVETFGWLRFGFLDMVPLVMILAGLLVELFNGHE